MATIKKMPEEKYPARPHRLEWRDVEGKRHFEYFKYEREARARRDEIGHRTKNLGERIVPSKITLSRFVGARREGEEWIFGEEGEGWLARTETKPSTRRARETNLKHHILPAFGGWKVQSIIRSDVQDFALAKRRKGLSRETVKGLLNLLHLILADSMERRIILANPAARVKAPKVATDTLPEDAKPKRRNSDILQSEAQISSFLAKAQEIFPPEKRKPWAALFTLAVYSGLREGELLALQWGDLNLEGESPRLSVRRSWDREEGYIVPKSPAALREVPILPEAKRVLLEWRMAAREKKETDRVFPLASGGYKRALRELIAAIRKEDRTFPRPSLHALRHTFASVMAARGVPPKVLQGWLGHSKIEMTLEVYAKVMSDSGARVVVERLAGFGGV